jgi:hypothetical protein
VRADALRVVRACLSALSFSRSQMSCSRLTCRTSSTNELADSHSSKLGTVSVVN